jgi:integral membrane protein
MSLANVLRFDTPPARLRATTFLEGCSFVLLLGVAMPLKYLADMPLAVRLVGAVHGVLFLAFVVLTLRAMRERGKPFGWGARMAVASILPFGTFALDRGLREDDEAWRRRSS